MLFKIIKKTSVPSLIIFLLLILSPYTSYAQTHNLVPIGKTIGITVGLNGVYVVNTEEFETTDGKTCCPAIDAGIIPGDIIVSINGMDITTAQELEEITNKAKGSEMLLKIKRKNEEKHLTLSAKKCSTSNDYKLGLWIKDSSSGIGTLTYYDPKTSEFGALGHGICDTDNKLTLISGGAIFNADVASVNRGEKGLPGELIGVFTESEQKVGNISSNSNCGINGKISNRDTIDFTKEAIPIAEYKEIHEGDATILSNIEGNSIEEYSIQILKINKDISSEKNFIIKITDKKLLEKTGGIIRGMSGSPIIQNGKLVGAITHVFINDPSRGYGIFIENMMAK